MLARSGTFSPSKRSAQRRLSGGKQKTSSGKQAVEIYSKLAAHVLETANRSAQCIQELLSLQKGLMTGVEEFLSFDSSLIDEPAYAIVFECAAAFESVISALSPKPLEQVSESVQESLGELNRLSELLGVWGEAVSEQEHYEGKVGELQGKLFAGLGDKLDRNRDKLNQAKQSVDGFKQEGEAELNHFSEKRTVIVRGTLISYLRVYLQMVTNFGGLCKPVADQCAAELLPGARVEIIALRKARDLNGLTATIECVDPADTRRCRVVLDSTGEQKSVKIEHLLPIVEEFRLAMTPEADGSADPTAEVEVEAEAEIADGKAEAEQEEEEKPEEPRWEYDPSGEPLSEEPRITFGHPLTGNNITLFKTPGSGEEGVDWLPVIASRPTSILNGVCLTHSPLQPMPPEAGQLLRHYFEVTILDAANSGTTRTLYLGFAWPAEDCSEDDLGASAASAASADGEATAKLRRSSTTSHQDAVVAGRALPESSRELPCAFVIGGDLTRAYLGGVDLGKVSGWRPLKDAATGSRIGCLLEQDAERWRLSIYQDGTRRCKVEATPPPWASGPPHGLVDVCGGVRRVQLRQGRSVLEEACLA